MIEYKIDLPKTMLFSPDAVKMMVGVIRESLTLAEAMIEFEAKKEAPYVFGYLRGSIQGMQTLVPLGVTIRPLAEYAADVELGSGPKTVEHTALARWAQRKFSVTKEEADGIATSVQIKIALRGTDANPFMQRAYQRIHQPVLSMFSGVAKKAKNGLGRPKN